MNPNRHDETSELGYLCAAGVVFLMLVAVNRLMRAEGLAGPDLLGLLDLVALATVADVAPLVGLNRALRGRSLLRGLYFLPVVTSWVVVALVWKWILNPESGALNAVLGWFGVDGPGALGVACGSTSRDACVSGTNEVELESRTARFRMVVAPEVVASTSTCAL